MSGVFFDQQDYHKGRIATDENIRRAAKSAREYVFESVVTAELAREAETKVWNEHNYLRSMRTPPRRALISQ